MNAVKGTWKNGRIVLDRPIDWPDDCRLAIAPLTDEEILGIREEDWPTTPEAMADWLKWYDSLEPLEVTADEEAEFEAWRRKIKEYSIAMTQERIAGLFE
jgi:hypothetical protein